MSLSCTDCNDASVFYCSEQITSNLVLKTTHICYLTVSMYSPGSTELNALLRAPRGVSQAVLFPEAWSPLLSSSGCWQNSLPCSRHTEVPLSCWLSVGSCSIVAFHSSFSCDLLQRWWLPTLKPVGDSLRETWNPFLKNLPD